jgi:ATP-dependent DNA helicase 2 subunit 1
LRFKYTPEDFKNPTIQKVWNEIEAIALEKEKPDEIIDLTIPDYERIKSRAGKYLDDFVEFCFPNGLSSSRKVSSWLSGMFE